MARNLKHIGKMKNNDARIVVIYRTLPGDHEHALVVGTSSLPDVYHDGLISLVESEAGQQANELADILAVRRFADNSVMLNWLHERGLLIRVPTTGVIMTPDMHSELQLDLLNAHIAADLGVSIEDLAIKDGSNSAIPTIVRKDDPAPKDEKIKDAEEVSTDKLSPRELRALADDLYKQAKEYRAMADELDPPATRKGVEKKTKTPTVTEKDYVEIAEDIKPVEEPVETVTRKKPGRKPAPKSE